MAAFDATMRTGPHFRKLVDGDRFTVVYTHHFVLRFTHDTPLHKAVSRYVSEKIVAAKIVEALPQISDIAAGDSSPKGVIFSRSLKLNMAWVLKKTPAGHDLIMTTSSVGEFHPNSPTNYRVIVNPAVAQRAKKRQFKVVFRDGISPALHAEVMADLGMRLKKLKRGVQTRESEMAWYMIDVAGTEILVDDANWKTDIYEVYVR